MNVAFLVSLAFCIAASANLPVILYTMPAGFIAGFIASFISEKADERKYAEVTVKANTGLK